MPFNEVSVIAIAEDKNGVVYFGGSSGVITYDDGEWATLKLPKGSFTIRAMDIGSDGSIAIGHNSGLIVREEGKWTKYTTKNSELVLGVVRAVKYTEQGQLYIGYGGGFGGGGFSIMDNGSWRHFNKTSSKITDHMVRDIEIDKNGTVWMATNNGVIKKEDDAITPILFRQGMFQNVVLDIALDDETVWIATNFGLIKMEM